MKKTALKILEKHSKALTIVKDTEDKMAEFLKSQGWVKSYMNNKNWDFGDSYRNVPLIASFYYALNGVCK